MRFNPTYLSDDQDALWIDYFSPEEGCTMRYNPVTGEIRSAAQSAESNQGSEETNTPGKSVGDGRVEKSTLDNDRLAHHGLPDPFVNPGTGAPLVPSSLQVPHTPSRTIYQSEPPPNPIATMDEKVRVLSIFALPSSSHDYHLGSAGYSKGHGTFYGSYTGHDA